MDADTLLENFEILAEAPGGISSLKKLIFELAISGRLVDQIPDEGDSQVLVNDLVNTRESRLKERSLSIREISIAGDSQPSFEIPNSWRWTRLGSICYPQAGFAFKSSEFNAIGKGLPLIRIRDISTDHTQCHYSGEYRNEFVVRNGDWLIGMDGNFNIHKWLGSDALLNQRVTRLLFLNEHISERFIAWSLQHQVTSLMGTKSYTTVDHLSTKQINEALIPVPPIAEQVRIVVKVDELMALCDQLEQQQKQRDNLRTATRKSAIDAISTATTPEELETAWKRINNNWDAIADTSESVASLRTLILSLAVRGQLANTLGNAKRREESFKELGSVLTLEYGKPLDKSLRTGKGSFPVYGANGVKAMTAQSLVKERGIVVGRKGSAGEVNMTEGPFWPLDVTFFAKFDHKIFDLKYLYYLLKSLNLPQMARGIKPGINRNDVNKLKVLSVDLVEQKRIVAKVDELMALCDQLESELVACSEVAEKFARSVVSNG